MIKPQFRVVQKYQKDMPLRPHYVIQGLRCNILGLKLWEHFGWEYDKADAIRRAEIYLSQKEADYKEWLENPPYKNKVVWKKP